MQAGGKDVFRWRGLLVRSSEEDEAMFVRPGFWGGGNSG